GGVGIATAVAREHADAAGLVVLDVDDPDLVREVAVYWYQELADQGIGASLLRALRAAPAPPGATAPPGPCGSRGITAAGGRVDSPIRTGADPESLLREQRKPCPRSSVASPS